MKQVHFETDFGSWREKAREALQAGTKPGELIWISTEDPQERLPGLENAREAPSGKPPPLDSGFRIPRRFLDLAGNASAHSDPNRWSLLYRVLWRLTHEDPHLLDLAIDPDIALLQRLDSQVRKDIHKMEAFVRFRKVEQDGVDHYIAWHRPDHAILKLASPFFARRFASMRWTILTPDGSAHWDGSRLDFGPGIPAHQAPQSDELETLWLQYYESVYNPARLKIRAMKKEMPVRHWKTLPESRLIAEMIRGTPARLQAMFDAQPETLRDAINVKADLSELRTQALKCTACPLFKSASQTVFGEGPIDSSIVFVGEQPGDQEDLQGRPFVGPAGQLLDRALQKSGIDRKRFYFTNSVKHFKFRREGARRIHMKPLSSEIAACHGWLEAEMRAIQPRIVVCLGATAAQAVLGRQVKLGETRGRWISSSFASLTYVTTHPSAILRMPDPATKEIEYQRFVEDLLEVRRQLESSQLNSLLP